MTEALRKEEAKFGTFKGVFVPSLLTIFGVIMYLRLGWVAGSAGWVGTILIVTLGSAITFLTALSISSIATNMRVGAGGAYYMISRSFGLEAGAAIGIPLFLAQALGISFYISGFAESVHNLFPILPVVPVAVVSLVGLTALAYFSADLALRAQLVILAVIIISLVSFAFGGPPAGGYVALGNPSPSVPFWAVFAVFFPAVTGIEAGVAMSGNLKNPARSLPIGTIASVLVGYAVYLAIPLVLLKHVPLELLRSDNTIIQKFAWAPAAVVAGIWGATLSSGLGSLLGAPRTLQAMARDRVMPSIFGKGTGAGDEPRLATITAFLIGLGGILLGDLDTIAPVLTMFFLTSYGFLNLATALEGLIGSPSWRPSFRTHWALSLLGAGGCFAAMLMIDAGSTFVAAFLTIFVYWLTKKRKLQSRWSDLRRGVLHLMARFAIYRLDKSRDEFGLEDPRTWRPNLLVLSGSPTKRWHLIELAQALTHGKGFLTVSAVVQSLGMTEDRIRKIEHSVRQFLRKQKVSALVEVTSAEDPLVGAQYLIRSYGLGPIYPNTVIFEAEADEEAMPSSGEIILTAYQARKNVVIVRNRAAEKSRVTQKRQIRVWIGGQSKANSGLMMALAFQLCTSRKWSGAELILSSIVNTPERRDGALHYLSEFLREGRLLASPEVFIMDEGQSALGEVAKYSIDSKMAVVGLRVPENAESAESYGQYLKGVLEHFSGEQETMFVLASQNLDFQKIFS